MRYQSCCGLIKIAFSLLPKLQLKVALLASTNQRSSLFKEFPNQHHVLNSLLEYCELIFLYYWLRYKREWRAAADTALKDKNFELLQSIYSRFALLFYLLC